MGAGERKQQHKPARDPTAVWIREMARREKEKLSELEVNKAGSYVKARLCMPLHGERAFGERENAQHARKPVRQAGTGCWLV